MRLMMKLAAVLILCSSLALAGHDNELVNPGFEAAIGPEWTIKLGVGTITRVTTPVNTGSGAGLLEPDAGGSAGSAILFQKPPFAISENLRVHFGGHFRQVGTVDTMITFLVMEGDTLNVDLFATRALRIRANGDVEYLRVIDRLNATVTTVLRTDRGTDFSAYNPISWHVGTTEDQSDISIWPVISPDGGTLGSWNLDDMWLGRKPMTVP